MNPGVLEPLETRARVGTTQQDDVAGIGIEAQQLFEHVTRIHAQPILLVQQAGHDRDGALSGQDAASVRFR